MKGLIYDYIYEKYAQVLVQNFIRIRLLGNSRGTLLVEWIIAISIFLLIICLALPLITRPSRYTLNAATQEVVYMLKKVQLWSMLGHKSNIQGRMLFVLHKQGYTISEDAYHQTVECMLPNSIESTRPLTLISFSALGLPYDSSEITLRDCESGETNRIWISVQTGRIRWEETH